MNTLIKQFDMCVFQQLFPDATEKRLQKFYLPFKETLEIYRITTKYRIAAFAAQVLVESGSLRYIEEIASGKAYEYREDLGNLEPEALKAAHACGSTTGKFYKGHGLMQITGYYNHKACGQALELDLVNDPRLLCLPKYAALSAGWYWNTRSLNRYADLEDIKSITKRINGGYKHLKERTDAYNRNLLFLATLE